MRERHLTLFDFLHFWGCTAGIGLGMRYGYDFGGWAGGVAGAVVGGYVGLVAGRLPLGLVVFWEQRSLKKQSSQQLRERLRRGDEYFITHLLLAHLMARGEDVASELPCIVALLRSDSETRRYFGWSALKLAFPEVASTIAPYQPSDSPEQCRAHLACLGDAGM